MIGFGELHARTDRAQVESSLAHFTADVLPAIAATSSRISSSRRGSSIRSAASGATDATAAVETTMSGRAETKTEIAVLVQAARAAKVQPHAMRVGCDDYARVAPPGKELDIEVDARPDHARARAASRPRRSPRAIASRCSARGSRVYGGALHNDRFPDRRRRGWSYAETVDDATRDHFVEIDLIVPELAADDPASQHEPWFPLLAKAARDHVVVIQRGARSYIVVLPKSG